MPGFLKFAMNVYTVDANGKRYPGTKPILFRLRTPIEDFREAAPGFPQGYWREVAMDLERNATQEMFNQATPIGPFAPLSDNPPGKGYASRKEKKYGDQAILMATGQMFMSFFEGADHVWEEGPMGMRWGTRNALAGYHFRGHLAGEGGARSTLPRRPLGMPPDDFDRTVQSAAVKYVDARYRIAGFRVAKEAGVDLTRVQASQVGRMALGGGYGAVPLRQEAMPL
jgi:hypothetical protein